MPYIRKLVSDPKYLNIHKHHHPHKGICFDDHTTDGRWYCEKCQRCHNGPKGDDFKMGGILTKRPVDRYLV